MSPLFVGLDDQPNFGKLTWSLVISLSTQIVARYNFREVSQIKVCTP